MKARVDYEARFHAALRRISIYSQPEWFDRHSEKQYGLSPEESIRMAYENVIGEAKAALAGYRKKRVKPAAALAPSTDTGNTEKKKETEEKPLSRSRYARD